MRLLDLLKQGGGGKQAGEDDIPEGYVAKITREQQVGLVEADELAPILICIDRRKHDELDAGIFEAHEAAVGTIASALADVGYKVEWAGRLQDFQRTFLSEREIAANAFAEGMFLVVHEQLGAAVVASEGSSDGGRGSSRRTRSQRQAPLKVLDGDALGKVEAGCQRAQRLSNVLRSRVKVFHCALLAAGQHVGLLLVQKLRGEVAAGGPSVQRELEAVREATARLRAMGHDCAANATTLLSNITKANASSTSGKVAQALGAANTALESEGAKAAALVWAAKIQVLLPAAQQHFLAAKRALSIAYGCGLVRSANGVHPSCQSSVLLLAGSACGLEQLYLLGEKHGVFTDNDKTAVHVACKLAVQAALEFAASIIPLEMTALARAGGSPALKQLESRLTLNLQADVAVHLKEVAVHLKEVAASNLDFMLFMSGKKSADQLLPAARVMLQQRGVLPGGKPGGGGESSRSSSCASSPTTPSDAAGGVQFWSDSDMEEQSAALVLTTGDAQLSEEFGKMSLKPGAAS